MLDLDGDGLELVALADSSAYFDIDGDGFAEKVGWVGPDDGLLAFDRNGNGIIDGRTELFPGTALDGFASLRALDTSGNNTIDSADANFAELVVWRDVDGDGFTDGGELQSLTDAGIASISLASTHLNPPQQNAGNDVTDTSTYTRTDGAVRTIADVWFATDQMQTYGTFGNAHADPWIAMMLGQPVGAEWVASDANLEILMRLPALRGYGTLPSLTAAMLRDPTLVGMVKEFVATPFADVTDAQVKALMFRWAGVDGIDPAARGGAFDARALAFMERFFGDPWRQTQDGPRRTRCRVAMETTRSRAASAATPSMVAWARTGPTTQAPPWR